MPAELLTLTEGITPEMVKLGLVARDLGNLAEEAHRVGSELGRVLDAMAPAEMTGEPAGNGLERDAFWGRFSVLVDRAEQDRAAAAGDG